MNGNSGNTFLSLLLVAISVFFWGGCTSGQSISPKFEIESWNTLKWEHIVRQGYDYSCGAAAVATLANGYFGDLLDEPLVLQMLLANLSTQEEIADRVVNGFSMLDLQQVAHQLGYIAVGVKLSNDAIFKLKGPVIVILKDGDVEHFVVLKGVDDSKAYFADSFSGNVRMPLSTFFKRWKGTALIFGKTGTGLRENYYLAVRPNEKGSAEVSSVRALRSIGFLSR